MRHLRIFIRPVAALVILMVISMFGWNSLFSKDSKTAAEGIRGVSLIKIDDRYYILKSQSKMLTKYKDRIRQILEVYENVSKMEPKNLTLDWLRETFDTAYIEHVEWYYTPRSKKERVKDTYIEDWIKAAKNCSEEKVVHESRFCNFRESRNYLLNSNKEISNKIIPYIDLIDVENDMYYLVFSYDKQLLSSLVFGFHYDKILNKIFVTKVPDDAYYYYSKVE